MTSPLAIQGRGAHTDRELSDIQMYLYDRPKRIRAKKSYREYVSDEENEELVATRDGDDEVMLKRKKPKAFKRKEGGSCSAQEKKQQQLSFTIAWLGDNYELREGMCLPRCVMYTHYLDFCKKNKLCPSGPATFGKVIRQKFPDLTTRRLGTRGQSKYHYYGIRVKETSQYFHAGYSKQGLSRFSTMKVKGEGGTKKFSLNHKARTLLPDFPNAKRLNLPKGVSQQKVETFIMMYRTHCQRLLDTVISANFDGINTFILHFWQGMPSHMITVLQNTVVVDVIAICDSILYKVLIDVLIPSTIQDLPDSLRDEIRAFASNLQVWLRDSLAEVPSAVREAKLKVAEKFSSALKRQVSFVHLAQTARSVLLSYDSVSRMIGDLRKIDFSLILSKTLFLMASNDIPSKTKTFVQEFDGLLSKQAPLEAYTEWLDTIVDRCVLKDIPEENDEIFDKRATKFLGFWSFITSKILEDLTLRSAPSFGVFHLIHATFQEYILLVVENQKMHVADKQLQKALQEHLKEGFVEETIEHWVDVNGAETGNRLVNHVNNDAIAPEKNASDPNNNNTNKTSKIVDKTQPKRTKNNKLQANIKPFHRPVVISNPHNPESLRQSFITTHTMPSNIDMNSQHPLQTSVANVTRTGMPQYAYPDEISRNAPPAEMAGFHSQDFISAFDKSFFNPVTVPNTEYLGSPWIPDSQSLTVLNNVTYDQAATNGNLEMGFHRNVDFGSYNYTGDMTITNNTIHPYDIQNPLNHSSDISYNQQTKEIDYSNYSNAISRYNSLYYNNMRGNTPAVTSDILNYDMGPNNGAPMDIDGILSHEAQIGRLGMGTVQ